MRINPFQPVIIRATGERDARPDVSTHEAEDVRQRRKISARRPPGFASKGIIQRACKALLAFHGAAGVSAALRAPQQVPIPTTEPCFVLGWDEQTLAWREAFRDCHQAVFESPQEISSCGRYASWMDSVERERLQRRRSRKEVPTYPKHQS